MSFSKKGKNELQWLTETQNLTNWIIPPPITEEIFCDASDYAWGGTYKTYKTRHGVCLRLQST